MISSLSYDPTICYVIPGKNRICTRIRSYVMRSNIYSHFLLLSVQVTSGPWHGHVKVGE